MHLWKEIIIILRQDKIMGTTHLELLSKDLNYHFEGKKVYCQLHLIKDL